jgi:hypothetical protein
MKILRLLQELIQSQKESLAAGLNLGRTKGHFEDVLLSQCDGLYMLAQEVAGLEGVALLE